MSGTVIISDQRPYMKIEILRGTNPREIHGAFSEVFCVFTVDRSTISPWTSRFLGGSRCIYNKPRPGRLRTSTDERNLKVVADSLQDDRRATCEELSRATGAKSLQENALEPTSVARGWATHSPGQC